MQTYSILLVDDDLSILKSIGPFLESLGYHVTTAESGEDAIELLNRSTFDLVITDLIMGDVDGYQVLETGKKLRSETMFIVLTGHNDPAFIVNALRLDADDYLIKPCEPEEMRFRVERCLEKLEIKKKAKQAEEALRESEAKYRTLFEDSPISLWEEDFSAVKSFINNLRDKGINDFRTYFEEHPEDLAHCAAMVKIVDINKATIDMYQVETKKEFLKGLSQFFTEEAYELFKEEILSLCAGNTSFEDKAINQTATGEIKYVYMKCSLAPGHEATWSKMLVSIMDITDLKQAEEALRESEEHYRSLIHRIQAAVVVHDADTQIIASNPKAQELLGLTEEQVLGKTAKSQDWKFLGADGEGLSLEEYPVNQVLTIQKPLRDFTIGIWGVS